MEPCSIYGVIETLEIVEHATGIRGHATSPSVFIHSFFICQYSRVYRDNIFKRKVARVPKEAKAYYIWAREHEGTERDTEGVGCDTS